MDVQDPDQTSVITSEIDPPLPGYIFATWSRLGAAIIDMIVLVIVSFLFSLLLGMVMGIMGLPQTTVQVISNIFGIVIGWLYFAIQESSEKQATVGKAALGLRVTNTDGKRISFLRASGRHFAKFISTIILLIGYIMILFTSKKQGLHDMLAGCLVLRQKKQA